MIALFDLLREQPHPVPCIAMIDDAAIHKGEIMESKRRQWANRGLYVYALPSYSPELNRIEILGERPNTFGADWLA